MIRSTPIARKRYAWGNRIGAAGAFQGPQPVQGGSPYIFAPLANPATGNPYPPGTPNPYLATAVSEVAGESAAAQPYGIQVLTAAAQDNPTLFSDAGLAPAGAAPNIAQILAAAAVKAPTVPTTPTFISAPAQPGPQVYAPSAAAPMMPSLPTAAQLAAEETAGNFYYTADLELATNTMEQYGDTWDNAQAIVNGLYAAGVQPGTVSQAMALGAMTGITAGSVATTTAASTAVLTDPSTWPWYYWAAGAAGAYLLLRKK